MTSSDEPTRPGPASHAAGTREVLDQLAAGDPEARIPLGEVMADLQQSAFGMLLFIAVLPSFLPVPGLAGGISGPLVMLVGAQLLVGLRKPWIPRFIAVRGPHRSSIVRFGNLMARPLGWLEKVVRPRLETVLDNRLLGAVTGLLLVALGLLLALPIPFTNYLFGVLLLLFVFALLERDGLLMLLAWLVGTIATVVFGFLSGNLVQMTLDLFQRWS
ncbi:MAG: exopolysaccharide biosynthesis protein [Pseudoxanthomonas sp.]